MRAPIRNLVAVGLVCLNASSLTARQRDFSAVEIRTVPVADGLYMLMGSGGNIGLSVGADGAFVIDDQFAPLTEKIMAAIRAVTDQPVRFVLNTHFHGDHTGGNENMGRAGAMIVAHENVRRRLDPASFPEVIERSTQAPPDALPVVTFNDRVNFHWNGQELKVMHVEHAHTDGDAIVYFTGSNAIHTGDNLFVGRYPFVDVPAGGNVEGMIRAAELMLSVGNSETRIIPGHGPLASLDEVRAFRDMLVIVRDRIRLLANDGRSEDDVVAARPTADLDAEWGGGNPNERFIRAVYQSVRR